MINQSRRKELLHYCPKTGTWIWIKANSRRVATGSKAGSFDRRGYLTIRIDGKLYKSGRLAFLYMTGKIPNTVDHIDRNKSNDRWSNLRSSTLSQNKYNTGLTKTNTSGVRGVYWHKNIGRWIARIRVEGKSYHLGTFKTIEDAAIVRKEAAIKYHKEFQNG